MLIERADPREGLWQKAQWQVFRPVHPASHWAQVIHAAVPGASVEPSSSSSNWPGTLQDWRERWLLMWDPLGTGAGFRPSPRGSDTSAAQPCELENGQHAADQRAIVGSNQSTGLLLGRRKQEGVGTRGR